jgi:hypothetical protein
MSDHVLPPTRVAHEELTRDLGTGETGPAPPFVGAGPRRPEAPLLVGLPGPGARLGDFDLLRVLGSGSFARVYLARQLSLGRMVALKVSRNKSQEARTLASLEHDHIVRVFSEAIDPDHDFRLLCMQYVAGTTLERVIAGLNELPAERRDGRGVLDVIDRQATDPAALDLGALRDREALAGMDLIEAGCWLGARLAEALAHAHGLGVLHRDVKPANILVNRYGRPLLADFNIASARSAEGGDGPFGGTVSYMAPEHLDAFNPEDFTPPDAVDARSDIWSLGAVLYELFTGALPYPVDSTEGPAAEVLRRLADHRRRPPPRLPPRVDAPPALERVLARCLAPRPEDRYQSAEELAADLDSCRELRRVQSDLPKGGAVTRWGTAAPFRTGLALMLVPQLAATAVNITYNLTQIVGWLSPQQESCFWLVVLMYNAVCWPVCLGVFGRQVVPVGRAWQALARAGAVEAAAVDEARRRALTLPWWSAWVAGGGWLLGGVVFPLGISMGAGPVGPEVYGHFLISFAISGLIAITYSVLAVEFVVVRVLYPGLWLDARQMHALAGRELGGRQAQLSALQFCAVLIPLAGATLLLWMPATDSELTFRLLVTALLALGMAGLGLALVAGTELRQTVAVLASTGAQSRRES